MYGLPCTTARVHRQLLMNIECANGAQIVLILNKVELFLDWPSKPPEYHGVLHVDDEQAHKRFVELYVRHQTLNLLANLKDGQLPAFENDSADMECQATMTCDEAAWIACQEGEARIQESTRSLGLQLAELSGLRSSLGQKLDGLQDKLAEAEDTNVKREEQLNRAVELWEQHMANLHRHKELFDDSMAKANALNMKRSQTREKLERQKERTKELNLIENLLGFKLLTCSAEHLSIEVYTPQDTTTKLCLSLDKHRRVKDITSGSTALNLSDVLECGTCGPDIPTVLLTVIQQLRQQ
uniref:uncharacterized protein isoform X3 n=1 Tax=Myxine glutinosa TaxID=7769 RepID=UPI00358F441F